MSFCLHCGQNFIPKSGLHKYCCRNHQGAAWRAANRHKQKAYTTAFRLRNPEKWRAAKKRYKKKYSREQQRKWGREYARRKRAKEREAGITPKKTKMKMVIEALIELGLITEDELYL